MIAEKEPGAESTTIKQHLACDSRNQPVLRRFLTSHFGRMRAWKGHTVERSVYEGTGHTGIRLLGAE